MYEATFDEHIAIHPLTRDGVSAISIEDRTRYRDGFPLYVVLDGSFTIEIHTMLQHKTIVFKAIGRMHLDCEVLSIGHLQTCQFLTIESLHRTIEVVVIYNRCTIVDVEEEVYKTTTILWKRLMTHGV